jgi:hypothetical protein
MDKRYQVFVSSTFVDLKDERQEVIESLIQLRCLPAGMEFFPASGRDKWEYIKKVIDDSDYYLLIIGGRYGSVDSTGISYTEKEYDYAVSRGLEPIVFIHGNPNKIPLEKSELNPELRERLNAFCEKAKSGLVKFWNKSEDLRSLTAIHVGQIIHDRPAVGWVKSNIYSVLPKETNNYPDFAAAKKKIIQLVQESPDNENINIKWLGSSMANATPLIEDDLLPFCKLARRKLLLDITMLSSGWKDIQKYNPSWEQQLKRYSRDLGDLKTDNPDVVKELNIYTYKQAPHLTGGLINNKHLFVAYCEWDEAGRYHVGLNQRYLYYKVGDKNWVRKYTDFIKWFEHLNEERLLT